MNIKNILKKLFKNYNCNVGISNPYNNLVNVPQRKDFKDESSQAEIDKYKVIILDALVKEQTITSSYLHFNDFQTEIDMNLNLLMRICFEEEWDVLSAHEKKAKSIIAYAKLKIYLDKILELERKIKYNYIALEEVKKDLFNVLTIKHFRNKRQAISFEATNLLGILCELSNQKYAILHKINACTNEFKSYIDNSIDMQTYLKKQYKRLSEYVQYLLPNIIPDIENKTPDIIIKTAVLERKLEIYAYKNSREIEVIRNSFYDLKEQLIRLRASNKRSMTFENILYTTEIKLRVLYEFGRNIVTDEDLETFYTIKFKYNIIGLYATSESTFLKLGDENRDFLEYSIYEKIVMDLLEKLLTNKGNILEWNFNKIDKDFWTAFNSFAHYNENKFYDVDFILTNKYVLLFLIDIWEDNLYYYFHNQKIKTPLYIKEMTSNFFDVEESLPLATIFELIHIFYEKIPDGKKRLIDKNSFISDFQLSPINDLYTLYWKLKDEFRESQKKGIYYMPQGITKLSVYNFESTEALYKQKQKEQIWDNETEYLVTNLLKKGKHKIVYFPESLIEIDVSLFSKIMFEGLFFNEGLKTISEHLKEEYHKIEINLGLRTPFITTKKIVIPSSLEKFPWTEINYNLIDELIFKNGLDSICLNNFSVLNAFVRALITFDRNKKMIIPKIKEFSVSYDKLCLKEKINLEAIFEKAYIKNTQMADLLFEKMTAVAPIKNYSDLLNKYSKTITEELYGYLTSFKMRHTSEIASKTKK